MPTIFMRLLPLVILLATVTILLGSPPSLGDEAAPADVDPGAIKNLEAAYPTAPEGMERKVVLLPHVERGADDGLQVEIVVGRVIETDGINTYSFGGTIHERTIDGWGFSYYDVEGDLKQAASTLIGGPSNPAPRFVAGPRTFVGYNSRVPLVVMVPEGCELRWRLWKADGVWHTAAQRPGP
jgi:ecotin